MYIEQLKNAFREVPKPKELCQNVCIPSDIAASWMLEKIDWATPNLKALSESSDVLPFLTPEGFHFLVPRVLPLFYLRHREEILNFFEDFIELTQTKRFEDHFSIFTETQKDVFWNALIEIVETLEDEDLIGFDFDADTTKITIFGSEGR